MAKILFLAQFPPPVHGAAVMNGRAYDVLRSEFDVVAINLSNARTLVDVGVFSFRKVLAIWGMYFSIFHKLVTFKPDMVYFSLCPSGAALYRDVFAVLLIKLFKVRIVYHLHGRSIPSPGWVINCLYSFVFSNSDVIHLSPMLFGDVSPFVSRERLFAVPNCVQDVNPSSDLEQRNRVQFLYLSNYIEGKGPFYLLEAAKILFDRGVDCRIQMAGQWYDSSFKSKIDSWLLEHENLISSGFILVDGPVYGEAKRDLLIESDVLVFPSVIDTFPLVVLEAQSAGLAVISTDVGAISELLAFGDSGIVCPQHDVLSLVDSMQMFVNEQQKLQLFKDMARKQYLNNYTELHFRKSFLDVFSLILNVSD
jgi:glycosyltransferase involved in cell wall biosynthesis